MQINLLRKAVVLCDHSSLCISLLNGVALSTLKINSIKKLCLALR